MLFHRVVRPLVDGEINVMSVKEETRKDNKDGTKCIQKFMVTEVNRDHSIVI